MPTSGPSSRSGSIPMARKCERAPARSAPERRAARARCLAAASSMGGGPGRYLARPGAAGYGRPVSASVAQRQPDAAPRLLAIAALGAAVAIALGVYGRVHDPSQQLVFTLFFSSTISMKVWIGQPRRWCSPCVQVLSALWVYGKLRRRGAAVGRRPRTASRDGSRSSSRCRSPTTASGRSASRTRTTRVLVHSLLGCAFYGAFAAKVTIVRSKGLPGRRAAGRRRAHVRRAGRRLADQRALVHRQQRLAGLLTVLRGIDTALEVIAWSLVVFFVILLFAGPRVVAEDKPEANAGERRGCAGRSGRR